MSKSQLTPLLLRLVQTPTVQPGLPSAIEMIGRVYRVSRRGKVCEKIRGERLNRKADSTSLSVIRYLREDFGFLTLSTDSACHGKGLRNRAKESGESGSDTGTGAASGKTQIDVMVLSTAAADDHGSFGIAGDHAPGRCAEDAEAE